jgi:hypothetical protein
VIDAIGSSCRVAANGTCRRTRRLDSTTCRRGRGAGGGGGRPPGGFAPSGLDAATSNQNCAAPSAARAKKEVDAEAVEEPQRGFPRVNVRDPEPRLAEGRTRLAGQPRDGGPGTPARRAPVDGACWSPPRIRESQVVLWRRARLAGPSCNCAGARGPRVGARAGHRARCSFVGWIPRPRGQSAS